MNDVVLTGGRYGLGSKDTPPSSIFALFKELEKDQPKERFTLGITDDVTGLSLPEVKPAPITAAAGTKECKFWGLGGDGTVGANKNSVKIIGDHTDKYVQAYFQYDSKKTGGVTISHLAFRRQAIRSPYYINQADFVACHNPAYIHMGMKMVQDVKPGGVFMINCQWSDEELGQHLNAEAKKYIADNNIQLYTINAIDKAIEIGMGKRTNTILQSAFFKLADVMPIDDAINFMKQAAQKSYGKKGQDVVEMNWKAIDAGVDAIHKVDVPASWSNPEADPAPKLWLAVRNWSSRSATSWSPLPVWTATACLSPPSWQMQTASGSRALLHTRSAAPLSTSPSGMLQSALAATSVHSCALMQPSVPSC